MVWCNPQNRPNVVREIPQEIQPTRPIVAPGFGSIIESAVLSKKLLDNAQKMWLSSVTHKDAEDASRAMAAFVNASCRDMSENAEAIVRIWRRFVGEAFLTDS